MTVESNVNDTASVRLKISAARFALRSSQCHPPAVVTHTPSTLQDFMTLRLVGSCLVCTCTDVEQEHVFVFAFNAFLAAFASFFFEQHTSVF